MKFTARVTSKGRVTLPKSLRTALGIHAGDVLEFDLHPGHAGLRAAKPWGISAGALKHLLPKDWKAPLVEEMDAAISQHVAIRARRSR